jgi:hypothetical protein
MSEPICTNCGYLIDSEGDYSECIKLHRFIIDWYCWNSLSPDDCPLKNGDKGDDRE